MEKKNTSPTVAEQKQILETCVQKLRKECNLLELSVG